MTTGPSAGADLLRGAAHLLRTPLGVVLMTGTTVLVGVLFGWLRMRSGSVYPSTFAHAALNGGAGVLLAALLPATQQDPAASLLGWAGWVIVAVVAAVLAALGTFRWAPQAAPRR